MNLGVSYIAAHLPDHIESDMKHLKEIGCSEVLFALQENHLVYLTGALKYGAGIAKENGLKPYVVIWGFANTFGGGKISKFMLENTDVWRVTQDGEISPHACLNNPRLVEKFVEFTQMCRDHGYEGMFVDEPTPQDCYCPVCREMFADEFRKDIVEAAGTEEHLRFRHETVRRYTQAIARGVKSVDDSLITMACVMPCDRSCFESVASIPELDLFGTDPYWLLSGEPLSTAVDYTRQVKEICDENGKTSQVWLNAWNISEGRETEVYSGGKELAAVGCDSMYTWSFRGGLGTNEESARPNLVWENVVRLYRELSGA